MKSYTQRGRGREWGDPKCAHMPTRGRKIKKNSDNIHIHVLN